MNERTETMAPPKVQNLVQFAMERGLVTDYEVLAHIHSGLRSMPTTKTYARRNSRELMRLQQARDATRAAYQAAVAAGHVIRPANLNLDEIASGHPDLASTQAARRLLARRRGRTPTDSVTGGTK